MRYRHPPPAPGSLTAMTRHTVVAIARWSARHRLAALAAWLGFVVLAVLAGNLAGTRSLDAADAGVGESRLADKALAGAYFNVKPAESVLIQPLGAGGLDPA